MMPREVTLSAATGVLSGNEVIETSRTLAQLAPIFADEPASAAMDQTEVVYRVQSWEPLPEGTPGAVCLATTFLSPGRVGDEYFMTRGHYHANEDRPELEVVISGRGMLVLMDRERRTRVEEMRAGTVHHVPPGTAHRVANVGTEQLVFVSYWASETGHDYGAIRERGFSARVMCVGGSPLLVPERANE